MSINLYVYVTNLILFILFRRKNKHFSQREFVFILFYFVNIKTKKRISKIE